MEQLLYKEKNTKKNPGNFQFGRKKKKKRKDDGE